MSKGEKNQAHRINITNKLFELAENCLKNNGMLVFLYYDDRDKKVENLFLD